MRPPTTHGASHVLAHARTPPTWDAQRTPAKSPRPNTSTRCCTPHLSAQHHTEAHSRFQAQQQPTTHTDNTLHASTRLITHTRTHTRSSAAAQIKQQQRQPANITQQRACSMQHHNHHGDQHRSRMLNATVAQQRLHRRSNRRQIHQRLHPRQRGSSSQSAAQQWQQHSSCQQQCTLHPRHAHAHTHASPHCHLARDMPCSPSEISTLPRDRTANPRQDSPRFAKTRQDSPRLAKTHKDSQRYTM